MIHKKILAVTGVLTIALIGVSAIFNNKDDVVIYTTMEDYRINQLSEDLKIKFPGWKIAISYVTTGKMVNKLQNEGNKTDCDIVFGLEATNAEILLSKQPEILHNMYNDFTGEYSVANMYDADVISKIPATSYSVDNEICKYHVFDKEAGCVMLNTKVLADHGISEEEYPKTFQDLLDPKFRNLICMPGPNYSGTGYYWFNGLVSCWGQEKAVEYFKELNKNFVPNGFTTSGSGPLKLLAKGEAGIGLGMSFQAAKEIHDHNEAGVNYPIKMTYFDITDSENNTYSKASPYTLYTMGVISGKYEGKVKDVYEYMYKEWTYKDKYMFDPETIYQKQTEGHPEYQDFCDKVTENFGTYTFPTSYMPMKNIFDAKWKENLLEVWEEWRNESYGQ